MQRRNMAQTAVKMGLHQRVVSHSLPFPFSLSLRLGLYYDALVERVSVREIPIYSLA